MEEPLEGRAAELVVVPGLGHAGAAAEVALEDGGDEDDVRLGVLSFFFFFFFFLGVEEGQVRAWQTSIIFAELLFLFLFSLSPSLSFPLEALSQLRKTRGSIHQTDGRKVHQKGR